MNSYCSIDQTWQKKTEIVVMLDKTTLLKHIYGQISQPTSRPGSRLLKHYGNLD